MTQIPNQSKTIEDSLSARAQYLELLSGLTRTVLLSNDWDTTLHTLAFDIKKLSNADDCYIVSWDEENQRPVPVATTAQLDFSFAAAAFDEGELGITASDLRAGHVVAVEDVDHSPHISSEIARRFPAKSVLGVPLVAGSHSLGAAIIAFNTPHRFTQEEIERAEQAGNHVALALWNFHQNREIQQSLKQSEALAKIGRALSERERIGTGEVMQLIVDSARELIQQAEESVIHLLDPEEHILIPKAVSGFDVGAKTVGTRNMRLGEGVAGQVIREGITINVGDINADPKFVHKDSLPTFRSLLVAPVQSGSQQIGTISVQSNKLNAFSKRDVELLNALSIQAAIAIENTRLIENIQQRLKEENALYTTSQKLASTLDTDELFEDVVNLLQQNFGYYHAHIYLLDSLTGDLVLKRGSGTVGAQLLEQGYRLPRGVGIAGHVAETALPFFTNNVNDVVFYSHNELLPGTQSELAVPLKMEGRVVGVLDVQHTLPHRLTEGDLQLVTAVADQLSVALQKASLYSHLQNSLQQEQSMRSQLVQSERLALVGRLLASVSHELNNPLQAIQNALFLLREEEHLSSQGKQDLDVILSEAERMAALIERLRSAYRPIRIGDFQFVQINKMVEDVYALTATLMRHKEIAFEFVPDPDLPSVPGISDQIRQVVLNLFLNAIEVMQPGGSLTVSTENRPEENEILLTVRDTGPGIDPDILPRIFEPFITSKHTGTGLGLTITQDIIEQHHGRLQASNLAEGGAIFRVWFPHEGRA